ncbi:MAG: transcriptional regulator PpsR [Rhodobacteraceae bacterium]|nr:transcriptional regulator PpsR [Paracoccaceae bacterium]MCY4196470.1 transcriptional regulator PpsR [Paracoccaceae bacterium]MCY4328045.1 transcriptional regulator PpsR [Paracoccaceae bacterium]
MTDINLPDAVSGSGNSHALQSILAAAADLSFVLCPAGRIQTVMTEGPSDRERARIGKWTGRPMTEFLTSESVPKFQRAMQTLHSNGHNPKRIELNHTNGDDGWQYPVRYSFHPAGSHGETLMIGRDLRAVAETQEQLVRAQIALEEGYEQQREYATLYKMLLTNTRDAVLLVSSHGRVRDANPAAAGLLGSTDRALSGKSLARQFKDCRDSEFVDELNSAASSEIESTLTKQVLRNGGTVRLAPKIFRAAGEKLIFCQIMPVAEEGVQPNRLRQNLYSLYLKSTDAIVICSQKGIIKDANESFLDLAGISGPHDLRAKSLADYLERGQVDLNVLIDNTVRLGRMQVYSTRLAGEIGPRCPVEVSSVYLDDQEKPVFGFVFRDVGRVGVTRNGQIANQVGAPNANVVDLVGSATLKEIVAEANDVIERMCIGAAVEMTGNNRAAAAQMLGLSRQSVYTKLRKYGLLKRDG